MGGKGGGGGGNSAEFQANADRDYQNSVALAAGDQPKGWGVQVSYKPRFEAARARYGDEQSWYNSFGGSQDPNASDFDNQFSRDVFTKAYGTYQPPAAPTTAAAVTPAATTETTTTPAATTSTDTTPTTAPIDTGEAIEQPTSLGNQLASTTEGQNYWVGGEDSYDNARRTTGRGRLTTTQT